VPLFATGQTSPITTLRWLSGSRNFPVYFHFGPPPLTSLPFDCQWIYASHRLLNQVNGMLQEWKREVTHLLGVASACVELSEALSNCPTLATFQQIDFTERIDSPDLLPNYIRSVLSDLSKSTSSRRLTPVETRRKGTGIKFWEYRQILFSTKTSRIDIKPVN
jgi:hypothetical protein